MHDRTTRSTRRCKLALAVGYAALTGATLSAYAAPTTEFEVSVYEGTPLVVWMLLGVALTVSLLVASYASGTRLGLAGLGLGGGSVGLVAALPLVRGYHFYGAGDGLTHVGWAADVAGGVLNPFGLFYPALHTVTVFFAGIAGIETTRAMLLVVLSVALSFLVFVPLCAKAITGRTEAAYAGAFVAFCLLPLNHIATHYMEPHPMTQAILFSPVVLYLLVQYVLCEDTPFETPLTRTGTLLALGAVALVLYHPLQAANTLIFFCTVSLLQAACRLLRYGGEIRAHRSLYGQTIWLATLFTGWAAGRETFVGAVNGVTREVAGYLLAGSTDAASVVSQRGSSLGRIGASTSELFAKLLLVPSIFAGLTAFVMLVSLLGRSETTEPETTALLRYFSAGLIVLIPYSLVFFVGSVSKLFFRNLGFVMVLVTILGAIAIPRLAGLLAAHFSTTVSRPATTLFLGAMLVLSMVVAFPSPYVYLGSGHVTDDRMGGYETLFAHQATDTEIYGVREGPWRYRHATAGVTGTETSRYEERAMWGENLTRARVLASEDRYFVLSTPDVLRETGIYEELRYSHEQLRSLTRQPGIHVVQTNGEVTVYHIEARPPPGARSAPPRRAGRPANRSAPRRSPDARTARSSSTDPTRGPDTPAPGSAERTPESATNGPRPSGPGAGTANGTNGTNAPRPRGSVRDATSAT